MLNRSCWDPKSLLPPPTVLLKAFSLGPAKALPGSKATGTTALAGDWLDAVVPASQDASSSFPSPWSLDPTPHICTVELQHFQGPAGLGEWPPCLANELHLFSFFAIAEPGWGPSCAPEDQEICESHSHLWAQ